MKIFRWLSEIITAKFYTWSRTFHQSDFVVGGATANQALSSHLSLVRTYVRCCFCYVSINVWLQEVVQVRCVRQWGWWKVTGVAHGRTHHHLSLLDSEVTSASCCTLSLSVLLRPHSAFSSVVFWAASILDSLWCQSESCASLMRTSAWTLFTLLKGFGSVFQKGWIRQSKTLKTTQTFF